MAKPVFIYAFDNLGPERFIELCGLILASRYKGFLLGGVGPDGGIDGEIDNFLGIWQPEIDSPLLNEVVHARGKVVFQFKHKVTARVGQARARKELLNLYKSTSSNKSELKKKLIKDQSPFAYVLVTNVEINSNFRTNFIKQCRSENPKIQHYQVIGLDELELWVTMEHQIRHHFFPTIFGPSPYNLRIKISFGEVMLGHHGYGISDRKSLFQISILNIGTSPSYVDSIKFNVIENNTRKELQIVRVPGDKLMDSISPKPGEAIEPGRKSVYSYELHSISEIFSKDSNIFPFEIIVYDEIGNAYRCEISDEMRNILLGNNEK
jgi:hypothetical protein